MNSDRRGRVDPRTPLWLFVGDASGGKSALIKRMRDDVCEAGEACAIVFTGRACWMQAWRDGVLICEDIARSASGTICCYAGGDIVNAFYQLHLRKLGLLAPKLDYDTILVALGNELNAGSFVALVQNDDRIDATYRLARVVCAVDPAHCSWAMPERQSDCIGLADTVVLMNAQDYSDSEIAATRNILAAVNPLAAIVCSEASCLPTCPAWKIQLGRFSRTAGQRLAGETGMVQLAGASDMPVCFAGNLYNQAGTNTPDDAHKVSAMGISIPGELDLKTYMHVVDELIRSLGTGVLRLSALLNVRHAEHPILFEIIGGSLIRPAYGSDRRYDQSDIYIVAKGLDAQATLRAFGQTTWKVAATEALYEAAF